MADLETYKKETPKPVTLVVHDLKHTMNLQDPTQRGTDPKEAEQTQKKQINPGAASPAD